jgi:hypothetical protein
VFRRDPKTSQWVEQDELHAADGASRDGFGFSVALDLDARTALIGSPGDDDNGSVSGSANVFHFDGSNWVQEQKLLASDGAFQAFFGHSVSLSGDAALIGARGVADGHGAAYVFRFDPVLANWAPEQKLVAADSPTSEQLGFAVALVGDTALVGAPFSWAQAPEHGAAYVFRFDGRLWVEHQLLLPDPNPWTSFFGYSLAMSGDQALIGALGEDAQKGAAYLFAGLRGTDCNANGSADTCDLLLGLGDDSNGNGIPDKCEQCPWDLDGSGVVGITDFLELLAMWGSSPGGPPDFDGDGTVGIVDFLALLANWGPCLKGPQIARPRDHADDR